MSNHTYQAAVIYIYINLCSPTLKSYVGFTTNFYKRKIAHKSASKNPEYYFQYAVRKYGLENFYCAILAETNDIERARKVLEPYYIKLCKSFHTENGYNLTLGSEGNFGWAPNDKTKKNMSNAAKSRCERQSKRPAKEVLYDLYITENKTYSEIGNLFNVGYGTIKRWIQFYEIPLKPKSSKIILLKQQIYDLYFTQRKSTYTIAKEIGVSKHTITSLMKRYEMLPRLLGDRNFNLSKMV